MFGSDQKIEQRPPKKVKFFGLRCTYDEGGNCYRSDFNPDGPDRFTVVLNSDGKIIHVSGKDACMFLPGISSYRLHKGSWQYFGLHYTLLWDRNAQGIADIKDSKSSLTWRNIADIEDSRSLNNLSKVVEVEER